MRFPIRSRTLIALLIFIVLCVVLVGFLLASHLLLALWEQFSNLPLWMGLAWLLVWVLGFAVMTILISRWMRITPEQSDRNDPSNNPLRIGDLYENLEHAKAQGFDTQGIEEKLALFETEKSAGRVSIMVAGEGSMGKSQLIRALIPGQSELKPESHVLSGSTLQINQYEWMSRSGDVIAFYDLPGLNDIKTIDLEPKIKDALIHSHLVLYLCDGDLSRSQQEALNNLLLWKKPVVLVLNKQDRLKQAEFEVLLNHLKDRWQPQVTAVVSASAGGEQPILVENADGSLSQSKRAVNPDVKALQQEIERILFQDPVLLESLRDQTVLRFHQESLTASVLKQRSSKGIEIVEQSSQRAMIGAMAALTPGSDIVIQGALAVLMVRQLSDLYDVPVKDLDIEKLLKQITGRLRTTTSIVLAIVGNGLKAFPGLGTLSGGIVHAVAYGMIFKNLGEAILKTFESQKAWSPKLIVDQFEAGINELDPKAIQQLAKLVYQEKFSQNEK